MKCPLLGARPAVGMLVVPLLTSPRRADMTSFSEHKIGPMTVAEGLFEALRSAPELLQRARMTPAMLVHEVAARDALLDWCEGRSSGFAHLPADVRALSAAFISDFLLKLSTGHPDFAHKTWRVPATQSPAQQAMRAVAQELRAQPGPAPGRH
jgi:hypothetical protein